MPITHTIFDLDGLILDTESLYTKNIQKILDFYDIKFKYEWKTKMMGAKPQEAAKFLMNVTGIDMVPEDFTKRLYEMMDIDFQKCQVMPGVYEILNGLRERNVPMCIATGSSQESYDSKMENHEDLKMYFSHVVCGGSDTDVKRGKPYPDIFLEAMKRFDANVTTDKVLVFEDSTNGVLAGLAAGMKVVWVPDEQDENECPDGVIKLMTLHDFDFKLLDD